VFKQKGEKFTEQFQQRSNRKGRSAVKDTLKQFSIFFLNTSTFTQHICKVKNEWINE